LNHKSDLYDDSSHVRVRLLNSKALPIDLETCLPTNVEEDKTHEYLKASTYTKEVEKMKSNISDYMLKKKGEVPQGGGQDGVVIMHVHGGGFVS
jgi:hypothetical protein